MITQCSRRFLPRPQANRSWFAREIDATSKRRCSRRATYKVIATPNGTLKDTHGAYTLQSYTYFFCTQHARLYEHLLTNSIWSVTLEKLDTSE